MALRWVFTQKSILTKIPRCSRTFQVPIKARILLESFSRVKNMKIRESGIHGIFGELYVLKPGLVLSEMQKCGAVEVCVVKLCRW